ASRADRVALRLEAAGRVDRQPAALLRPAFADRARPFAFANEAHRLVLDQLRDGEAVMYLGEREVAEPHAGVGERTLPGLGAALELEHVPARHREKVLHV